MNASGPPLTKRQYLPELVYEKNRWDEPLFDADKANGFLGWHERGYLRTAASLVSCNSSRCDLSIHFPLPSRRGGTLAQD